MIIMIKKIYYNKCNRWKKNPENDIQVNGLAESSLQFGFILIGGKTLRTSMSANRFFFYVESSD
jgi:hypothetical protein